MDQLKKDFWQMYIIDITICTTIAVAIRYLSNSVLLGVLGFFIGLFALTYFTVNHFINQTQK